jgi:hypothetical protein
VKSARRKVARSLFAKTNLAAKARRLQACR